MDYKKAIRGLIRLILPITGCMLALCFTACRSGRNVTATSSKFQKQLSKNEISRHHPATAKLLTEANSWIGTPYKYAGTDRSGVDCSGFTQTVFRKALAIALPRNSVAQSESCTPVRRNDLMAGDLVFFSTNSKNKIGHVGIYVGDGRMIHASTSQGVTLASIDSKWFADHYRGGGRVSEYYSMIGKRGGSDRKRSGKRGKDGHEPDLNQVPSVAPLPPLTNQQIPDAPVIAQADSDEIIPASMVSSPDTKTPPDTVSAAPIPVRVSQSSKKEVTPAEARRRVLAKYKELPPDSVMSSFYE